MYFMVNGFSSQFESTRDASSPWSHETISFKPHVVKTSIPYCFATSGKLLKMDGYTFVDTDSEIEKRCGCTIKELIAAQGETAFRDVESAVIRDMSAQNGLIVSTGGGAILRDENVRCLKRNGKLFFLNASLSRLRATDDRPLSDTADKLAKLYADRIDIYRATADVMVPDMATPDAEAAYILEKRTEGLR